MKSKLILPPDYQNPDTGDLTVDALKRAIDYLKYNNREADGIWITYEQAEHLHRMASRKVVVM